MLADGLIRVAVAQFAAAIGDVRANLAQMRRLLEEAARDHADLICFPELCVAGYLLDPAAYGTRLLASLSRADETLRADALRLGVRVIYGTARRQAGQLCNLVTIIEPDGGRTDYVKTHLAGAERSVFAPGRELVLSADGDLGLGCCYDLAFPGFCSALAGAGASVLVFPMAWEEERAFVFEGIVTARAIENIAYVVCANQCGVQGMLRFHGRSKIISPLGNVLTESAGPGLGTADLDLGWVARLRSYADNATYPLLADRRSDMPVRRGPGAVPAGTA